MIDKHDLLGKCFVLRLIHSYELSYCEQGQATSGNQELLSTEGTDAAAANLRGLVREHLRHGSDSSSIYPNRESKAQFDDHAEYDVRIPSMYATQANPWDADDYAIENYKLALSKAAEQRQDQRGHASVQTIKPIVTDVDAEARGGPPSEAAWHSQLERQHVRAGSSETQAERTAFAEELAQRQRAIQENLRVKSDHESSRSPSPSIPKQNVFESSFNALGMLKSKSSRDSLAKAESRNKRQGVSKLANDANNPLTAHEKHARNLDDRNKSPMGRTLHSRMPRASEDSKEIVYDPHRVRQNSMASTLGRETSDSPSITLAESSRTSASREEVADEEQAANEHASHKRVEEPTFNRTYGYFEARNPQMQYKTHAEDGLDGQNFPFDNSGDIVEETRMRSNSAQHEADIMSQARPPMPPLITGSSAMDAKHLNGTASPMSDTQVPTPYSANSTPPLSSVSSPSLRSDAHDLSLSSQLMDYRSRGQEMEVGIHPSQFQFPAREAKKHQYRRRGPTITKSDISEPRFISATSTIDTVSLPAGASLSNGMTSDIDVVLQAQNSAAAEQSDALAAAMLPFQQQDMNSTPSDSRAQSPNAEMAMSSISVTRMPPPPAPLPVGGNSFRKGFLKFGGHRNKPDEEDDYVSRPSGGRLRIRKISNEDEGVGKPRHRVVGAAEMEQSGFI